ncbi:DNA polymerase III subunit delta [Leucobacter denitrificans]|uniref:DNA-directed DNA polymerase n=1 Tax=Leucobacter denitrificans TaxID=683042 RepID=A0A7G9S7J9_9MICO|nr:DNA polymerase III subunit delta [Leucobacter denitrificans]QNN63824.1 DNA polymerase III subunit delta [Leucobacter denitrificans]
MDVSPAPVVLVSGPEEFFADRASQRIRDLLREAHAELEVHDIDAASYGAGELFTIASPSLFAEPRLIRVSGVEKSSDAFIEDAKRYVSEFAEDTTLVLRHTSGQRGKGLLDLVRKTPGAIEVPCPELKKDQERLTFAQGELRRLGAQATPGAVRMLAAAYASGSVSELAGACAQLVSDSGTQITEESVNRATEGRVEASGFKVADAAIAGKQSDALVLLRQAILSGTPAIPILAALNMKLRGMARVFGAYGSSAQLAKQFGMAPWMVDRAMKDIRGWQEADLARAIDLAAETELKLKGGSRDPDYAMERFVSFVARRGRERG